MIIYTTNLFKSIHLILPRDFNYLFFSFCFAYSQFFFFLYVYDSRQFEHNYFSFLRMHRHGGLFLVSECHVHMQPR